MTVSRARQLDRAHVWHPFTQMQAYCEEHAPVIVAAEGFELIDEDGRRYLDGHSSLWCNIHGHRVPEIDAAMVRQLHRVAHTTQLGLANDVASEFAAALVSAFANNQPAQLTKVFFSDDGSTAIEAAAKMALQYHQQRPVPQARDQFITLGEAYHGDTLGAVSLGRMENFHAPFRSVLFNVRRIPPPAIPGTSPTVSLEHSLAALRQLLELEGPRIAAMVIEPLVQAAAGMWVHPPGFLREVRRLTQQHGVLLIADEVATGFGRTGHLFACHAENVTPDLLCLSKGITGGYLPLAATLATDDIYNAFLGEAWQGRQFFHGHTYTGNPLACAAGLASLQRMQSHQVVAGGRAVADRLQHQLSPLATHRYVREVRQCGTMVGVELTANRATGASFPRESRMGHCLTLACRKRGVIVRNIGDVLVLMPAPAMPLDAIDRICAAVIAGLDELS